MFFPRIWANVSRDPLNLLAEAKLGNAMLQLAAYRGYLGERKSIENFNDRGNTITNIVSRVLRASFSLQCSQFANYRVFFRADVALNVAQLREREIKLDPTISEMRT